MSAPHRRALLDDEAAQQMHIVTVQFAIVLDDEVPIERELADLARAIGILYGDYGDLGDGPGQHPDPTFYTPEGEWQIVNVGPAQEYGDLSEPAQNVVDLIDRARGETA